MAILEVKKPKLYIMCGLAFSGKSTLARKIATITKSQLIAFDTLWVEIDKHQSISRDESGWKLVRKIAQERIIKALKVGYSVVYDDTNVQYQHREEVRTIAKQLKLASIVIYLETPLEVILQRETENKRTRARHDVDPINIQEVVDQLQIPSPDTEKVIIFRPEDEINTWIQSLNKLQSLSTNE